jgi:hypothetical protein
VFNFWQTQIIFSHPQFSERLWELLSLLSGYRVLFFLGKPGWDTLSDHSAIYRVFQEERSIFWEVTVSVILRKMFI